jgi:hypothetical protein
MCPAQSENNRGHLGYGDGGSSAAARRQLLTDLSASRRQAQNTYNKGLRRAPSFPDAGDVEDVSGIRTRHFSAKYPIQILSRLSGALAKYSNPPGKERDTPRLNVRGRREDTAGKWLFEEVTERLSRVPVTERDALRCRLLEASGFLHAGHVKDPDEAHANASDTIKKKLSRLKAKSPARSKTQS